MSSLMHEIARLDQDLFEGANRTSCAWDRLRAGSMREFVLERLRASPGVSDLGREWYPIQPDHPFPGWCRKVPGEEVRRCRDRLPPGGRSLVSTMVWEPLLEVMVELRVGDLLPGRDVVLVHPTLLLDYLVAFELTHQTDRLAGGRYLSYLRDYDGPGGELFLRPSVYHGYNLGWSAGEIRISFT